MKHNMDEFNKMFSLLPEHTQEILFNAVKDARDRDKGPVITRALEIIIEDVGKVKPNILKSITGLNNTCEFIYELKRESVYSERDKLIELKLKGLEAFRKLIKKTGGLLPSSTVSEILGISRQAVNDKRKAGKIICLSISGGKYKYPAFQFYEGGIIPGLGKALEALGADDPWMESIFMLSKNYLLNERAPIEMLKNGKVDEVITAAGAFGEQGA